MRLVLIALLVLTMAGAANAVDLSKGGSNSGLQFSATRTLNTYTCVGQSDDNALYQNSGYAYGNAYSIGAIPGPLMSVQFAHNGWGFSGPYDFTLYVYDAPTCTVIGSVAGLVAADAAAGTIVETFDVSASAIVASGDVLVLIAPLTCLAATDCYPDLSFDYTTPPQGCGSLAQVGVAGSCRQVTTASGILDFLEAATFDQGTAPATGACCVGTVCTITTATDCAGQYMGDGTACGPNTCVPVPVELSTWGAVKALYR
jgi:hypothetical protein